MKKMIIFAVVFAVIAGCFTYMYMSSLEVKYKSMAEPVKVVVATKRILQGTVIEPHMIEEKKAPKEYMQPKAFQDIKDLFTGEGGSAVYISLNTIEEGEQILSTKVSKTNQDTGISNLIPEGKKALSINFNTGTSSVLTPGARVDIFSVLEYSDSNKEIQESIIAVAQNILVLAVGNKYIGITKKDKADADDDENSNNVTLAVSIEEAQKILLANEKGNLKYVIRPSGDVEISDIEPLKLSSIVKGVSKTLPPQNHPKNAKSANQKEVLEIINKYGAGK
jgi:pilus assembly protein CpaB